MNVRFWNRQLVSWNSLESFGTRTSKVRREVPLNASIGNAVETEDVQREKQEADPTSITKDNGSRQR